MVQRPARNNACLSRDPETVCPDFTPHDVAKLINIMTDRLYNKYEELWLGMVNSAKGVSKIGGSKLRTYCLFKRSFNIENYLAVLPFEKRRMLTKLRISYHQLAIEKGRYKNIPVDQRFCDTCKENVVEDELHFLLECKMYNTERDLLYQQLSSFTDFVHMSKQEKAIFLFSCMDGDSEVIRLVGDFVYKCFHLKEEAKQL